MRYKILLTGLLFTIVMSASILYHTIFYAKNDGCSTWIAFGPAVEDSENKIILHKNRDMTPIKKNGMYDNNMIYHEVKNGLYRYIATGEDISYEQKTSDLNANRNIWDTIEIWTGVNEAGLAAASNFIPGTFWFGPYEGSSACREILENCSTVKEAEDWLQKNKARFVNGNLVFVADTNGGAVFEVKQRYHTFGFPIGIKITNYKQSAIPSSIGIGFQTNHYKIFENLWMEPHFQKMDSLRRNAFLNKTIGFENRESYDSIYGEINAETCKVLSTRYPINRKLCYFNNLIISRTLGATTVEIDRNDPLKSILHFADGYPALDNEKNLTLHESHFKKYIFSDIIKSIYDFNGITTDDPGNNLYIVNIEGPDIPIDAGSFKNYMEASDEDYANISSPYYGQFKHESSVAFTGQAVFIEMTIDEAPDGIDYIDLVFQGEVREKTNINMYIKETANNDSWLRLGDATLFQSKTNDVIRRSLTDNLTDYVGEDGLITFMIRGPEKGNTISVSYVKLEIFHK